MVTIVAFYSPGVLIFGYGCTVHVGIDVGAGDIEVDVIYISLMSVQYIGYLVPYKNKVQRQDRSGQLDNWTTCSVLYSII